jgi:hypothetical protein
MDFIIFRPKVGGEILDFDKFSLVEIINLEYNTMGIYYEGLVYTWSSYAILFTPGPMAYATIMVYK